MSDPENESSRQFLQDNTENSAVNKNKGLAHTSTTRQTSTNNTRNSNSSQQSSQSTQSRQSNQSGQSRK